MPSRMSCSLTTTSDSPNSSMSTRRISAPGADDVDPARVHDRQRRAASRGSRPAGRRSPRGRRPPGSGSRGWRRRRRRAGRSASAATVVTEPARPTRVAASPTGTSARTTASAARMSASARATSSAVGRVAVQVPLGQPDAADVDRAGRAHAGGVAEHELGRAAADVDHQERRLRRGGAVGGGRRVQRGGGAEEGQLRLLAPGDRRPGGCPRVASTMSSKSPGWPRRGSRWWRPSGPPSAPRSRAGRRVLGEHLPGALDRLGGQPAGGVDALRRAGRPPCGAAGRCAPRPAGRRRPAGGWSWCRSRCGRATPGHGGSRCRAPGRRRRDRRPTTPPCPRPRGRRSG